MLMHLSDVTITKLLSRITFNWTLHFSRQTFSRNIHGMANYLHVCIDRKTHTFGPICNGTTEDMFVSILSNMGR